MNTRELSNDTLEAIARLSYSEDWRQLRGVLLTYQNECLHDLRRFKEPPAIYSEQGKLDAIEDILGLVDGSLELLSVRRK